MIADLSRVLDPRFLHLDAVRVGAESGSGTPTRYATVLDGERPFLRIDLLSHRDGHHAFEEVVVWRDNVVVGFGCHVYAVSLLDRSVVSVPLGCYFGYLYPTPSYLLVASGTRLFRMEPDRSILWRSEILAVDGVLVHEPEGPVILGEAEQDPPGDWQPFALSPIDGRPPNDAQTTADTRDIVEVISSRGGRRRVEIVRRRDGCLQVFLLRWIEEVVPDYGKVAGYRADQTRMATLTDSLERARAIAREFLVCGDGDDDGVAS